MSDNKYFSLISGEAISRGINDTIIKAEDFAQMLSSMELLEKVKEDAAKYRESVTQECEKLKDEAQKTGFGEGYKAWVDQIGYLEKEIGRVREEMMKLLLPVALKAAKKIVATELQMHPEAILDIATSVLKVVAQHKRVVLYTNKDDYDILEANKGQLKNIFEQLESLSIRERDDVERGGVVIETEGGIINAQIKDRWRNLEAAFEALAAQLTRKEGTA